MSKIYQYFVEGECEEKLINALKSRPIEYLTSGKVMVFNFTNKLITNQRIAVLNRDTTIILVYDIDVNKTEILDKNIEKLRKFGFTKIYHVQSIDNFEDEIVYSTNLKSINSLFGTVGTEELKKEFIHSSNIIKKLDSVDFNKDKLWSRTNTKEPFKKYSTKESLKIIRNK
ncbi:MAG: hypothetical protein K6E20_07415 [Acholeplasmatales bacterium]|nr:hypothetical protein [Acholeplasmatales bacterium]